MNLNTRIRRAKNRFLSGEYNSLPEAAKANKISVRQLAQALGLNDETRTIIERVFILKTHREVASGQGSWGEGAELLGVSAPTMSIAARKMGLPPLTRGRKPNTQS